GTAEDTAALGSEAAGVGAVSFARAWPHPAISSRVAIAVTTAMRCLTRSVDRTRAARTRARSASTSFAVLQAGAVGAVIRTVIRVWDGLAMARRRACSLVFAERRASADDRVTQHRRNTAPAH